MSDYTTPILVTVAGLTAYLGYRIGLRVAHQALVAASTKDDVLRVPPGWLEEVATKPKATKQPIKLPETAAGLNAYVVNRGLTAALRVMRDPDVQREGAKTFFKGDKRFLYTSKLPGLIGWKVYLLQPLIRPDMTKEESKHTWVVHSPSSEAYMLPPEVCLERGLDAAWGNDEVRRNELLDREAAKSAAFVGE